MDAFGRMIAIVLTVILIFLLPIKYVAINRDAAADSQAHFETVKFADQIMLQGYLTTGMYNDYLYKINTGGQLYEVEIIHGRPTEGVKPASEHNPAEEASYIRAEAGRLQNSTVDFRTANTLSLRPMVTGRSGSVPISLTVVPSSYEVFNGTEPAYTIQVNYDDNTKKVITEGYTKAGFSYGAGTKTVSFTYTENEVTVSATVVILVRRNTKTCVNGHTYELDDYDNDYGCPVCVTILKSISAAPEYLTLKKGSDLPIMLTATYMDEHTGIISSGWTSSFDNTKLGNQLVTVSYEGKTAFVSVQVVESLVCPICGREYEPGIDGTDPGCPVCSKLAVSIAATPEKQVVPIGEELSLEVAATYKDGHHEYVDDWSSNFNPFKVGTQKVSVFYESVTTEITVIVESETETTCPVCGTVYNPILYPNGCPSCSQIVEGIEARLRNGGTQVQLGSELSLTIIQIYKDGHRVITYNDWIAEGYRPEESGEQEITVYWRDLKTTLTIEVVNSLSKVTCPNGHVYYLNEDGSDPGCPYCNDPAESSQSRNYSDCVYTDTILQELYANGTYYFDEGDYVTVSITPKTVSYLQKLKNMFSLVTAVKPKYSYGGRIS